MKNVRITIIFLALLCCSLVLTGCKDTTKEEKATTAAVEVKAAKVETAADVEAAKVKAATEAKAAKVKADAEAKAAAEKLKQ